MNKVSEEYENFQHTDRIDKFQKQNESPVHSPAKYLTGKNSP